MTLSLVTVSGLYAEGQVNVEAGTILRFSNSLQVKKKGAFEPLAANSSLHRK
jgi:hypothetical protein